jgi:hypothetical protein
MGGMRPSCACPYQLSEVGRGVVRTEAQNGGIWIRSKCATIFYPLSIPQVLSVLFLHAVSKAPNYPEKIMGAEKLEVWRNASSLTL